MLKSGASFYLHQSYEIKFNQYNHTYEKMISNKEPSKFKTQFENFRRKNYGVLVCPIEEYKNITPLFIEHS